MKTKIFILSIFLSISALSQGIIKKVYTNKSIYTYGETVYITLKAINTSSVEDSIIFPDLCEAIPYVDDISYLFTFGIGCSQAISIKKIPAQDSIEWVFEYPNSNHPELFMPIGQHNVFGRFRQITSLDPYASFVENTDTIDLFVEEDLSDLSDEINRYTYSISQNYPNPFNPSTVISYQLPVSGLVSLKIYDILGSEVTTLVNEVQNPGTYLVEFNSTSSIRNLASGIYFYRLQAGNYIETKKMLLIK